jgi:Arc-like DNA binding domain
LPRKPADVAHINFRIREHLRRKLEAEAKRHQVSLNSEMHSRLEQSFEATPVAKIQQDIDRQITLMETAWLRFDVTPTFLALVDQLTTKILNHGVRDELGRELSGSAWVEFGRELSGYAQDVRRLRATVGQPLREPGPGVRLQGEPES